MLFGLLTDPLSSIPQFLAVGQRITPPPNCMNREWLASGIKEQIEILQAVPVEPATHIVNRLMKVCQLRHNATEILADQHVGH